MLKNEKIEYKICAIHELNLAEYNPRKISPKEFFKLRKSIKEFGFVEPVVVNKRNNVVVGGNQRVRAAKAEGLTEIPVIFVDLDEKKEKALNLALNRISGEWDREKVAEILFELDEHDLNLTGFDDEEIKNIKEEFGPDIEEESAMFEFTEELLESHNYLVFYFDNELDWNVIKDKFGIKAVNALDSKKGYERAGIGRVVNGSKLLEKGGTE